MRSRADSSRDGRNIPRPVGWRAIVNPTVSRRSFIAGGIASPLAASSGFALDADPVESILEFDLSDDGSSLSIRQFPKGASATDCPTTWVVLAAAFGPTAWFEFRVAAASDTLRTLIVRGATFGDVGPFTLQFSFVPTLHVRSTGSDRSPQKYPTDWSVSLTTTLWGPEWHTAKARFFDFVAPCGSSAGLATGVAPARADALVRAAFDGRVAVDRSSHPLVATFRTDCCWRLSRENSVAATCFETRVTANAFVFGWHRDDGGGTPFLYGLAENDIAVKSLFTLGDAPKIRIEIQSNGGAANGLEWEVRRVKAALGPSALTLYQTYAKVSFGSSHLAVVVGDVTTASNISAASLFLSDCLLPVGSKPLLRVLWGNIARKAENEHDAEIITQGGRLRVDAPESNQPAPPSGPAPAAAPAAINTDADASIAAGDRSGAPDATVWALFDRPTPDSTDQARRVAFDLALHWADVALPDVSRSRLAFGSSAVGDAGAGYSDLRLAYDDGVSLAWLPLGEYPQRQPSSHVWLGEVAPGREVARFDLSRATLSATRDLDLVHLRFRFLDFILVLKKGESPTIQPAHANCRVLQTGSYTFRDDRPVLVVEFDSQHLFEEAIFGQKRELPDVVLPDLDRGQILDAIEALGGDIDKVQAYKQDIQTKKGTSADPGAAAFAVFCTAFGDDAKVKALPKDQRVYIGPFALDPDAMGFARRIAGTLAQATVTAIVDALFQRAKSFIAADHAQTDATRRVLAPVQSAQLSTVSSPLASDAFYLENALRNEAVLEQQDPLYGVFRDFYRDRMVRAYKPPKLDACAVGQTAPPATLEPFDVEFFADDDRPLWPGNGISSANQMTPAFPYCMTDPRPARLAGAKPDFVQYISAAGSPHLTRLMEARLSHGSRLAFRVNCQPPAQANALDAGLPRQSMSSPTAPAGGGVQYGPLPFTFEALTDWSHCEPAVTRRAQKLFESAPDGIVPPIGQRAANLTDGDNLVFQGISRGAVTAEQRLGEIRASMARKPTNFETAIEIPSRLTLSTAQDAIWFTPRTLPWQVVFERKGKYPSTEPSSPIPGTTVLAPGRHESSHERLWTARLGLDGLEPNLRVVDSPDLRPGALTWLNWNPLRPTTAPGGSPPPPRNGGSPRQLGQGAPPRGALAPWFIGSEQMDAATLTPSGFNAELPDGSRIPRPTDTGLPAPASPGGYDDGYLCQANVIDRIWTVLRKLCERNTARSDVDHSGDDVKYFRTTLDAYDRHELVLLSSAYGLPVIGKRAQSPGSASDSQTPGALVGDSGQLEPGDDFAILDADDAQAIQRPQSLRAQELWLSALGGTFVHDTRFSPSAGANDLFGGKIFDGFSIERWREEIVLGREIVGEVVYKGYLFPLGHRASLVKLTERVFLTDAKIGVKAVLVQRIFVRVGRKSQSYPAVGQPFDGRLWCAKDVSILTSRTPDLQDPLTPSAPSCTLDQISDGCDPESATGGRISLDGSPGLAFWPRLDETEQGLFKFSLTIDGAQTEMPLIFVDNVAATISDSLSAVAFAYRVYAPWKSRRIVQLREQKVRYAQESKSGDCSFKTDSLVVSVSGREGQLGAKWADGLDAFDTTAILEGAEQPPFYPALEVALIRLEQVERFSGRGASLIDVQYDGRYARFGFTAQTNNATPAKDPTQPLPRVPNPLDIYLNLRHRVLMAMNANGDRSGGVGRPESMIVAIGRANGPVGARGDITYQLRAPNTATGYDKTEPETSNEPPTDEAALFDPSFDSSGFLRLLSLADFFDPFAKVDRAAHADLAASPGDANAQIREVLKIFFSDDAKILGCVSFHDLLDSLGFDLPSLSDATPALKQTLQFGSGLEESGQELVEDIHGRILAPLLDLTQGFQKQWQAANATIQKQTGTTGTSLASAFPEVDNGLSDLIAKISTAINDSDPIALAVDLSAIYESARSFAAALDRIAASPVARLKQALVGQIQQLLAGITGYQQSLADWLKSVVSQTNTVLAPSTLADWISTTFDASDPKGQNFAASIGFEFAPQDISSIANQMGLDLTVVQPALTQLAQNLTFDAGHYFSQVVDGWVSGHPLSDLSKQIADEVVTQAVGTFDHAMASAPTSYGIIRGIIDYELGALLSQLTDATVSSAIFVNLNNTLTDVNAFVSDVRVLQKSAQSLDAPGALGAAAKAVNLALGAGPTFYASVQSTLNSGLSGATARVSAGLSALFPSPTSATAQATAYAAELQACFTWKTSINATPTQPLNLSTLSASSGEPMSSLAAAIVALQPTQSAIAAAIDGLGKLYVQNAVDQALGAGSAQQILNAANLALTRITTLLGGLSDLYWRSAVSAGGFRTLQAGVSANANWAVFDDKLIDRAWPYLRAVRNASDDIRVILSAIFANVVDFDQTLVVFRQGMTNIDASGLPRPIPDPSSTDKTDLTTLIDQAVTATAQVEPVIIKALVLSVNRYIAFVRDCSLLGSTAVGAVTQVVNGSISPQISSLEAVVGAQVANVLASLAQFGSAVGQAEQFVNITASVPDVSSLLNQPIFGSGAGAVSVKAVFTVGSTVSQLAAKILDSEHLVIAEWRRLQTRARGLPDNLKAVIVHAANPLLAALDSGYGAFLALRNQDADILEQTALSLQSRRSLFAPPFFVQPPLVSVNGPDDDATFALLKTDDRLAEESTLLHRINNYPNPPPNPDTIIGDFVRFLESWTISDQSVQAAPLQIARQISTLASEALKGELLALIDISAFRDALLDAIARLVPTKATFSYDFASSVIKQPDEDDLFQAAFGSRFTLSSRIELDLLGSAAATLTTTGSLGPFAIKLVGGLVDALTLRFGGASFEIAGQSAPRFDIAYQDYVIGSDLSFVQELQSYLTPSDGAGFHIGPSEIGVGIEVGYGVNLGGISIGPVSFFNIIFDVSAELPFDNRPALFKTSLGTRLSPFTISVLPYAGSGFFSIFSAADGIRGFEAGFLFGGGGSLNFGPLQAQVQVQVGVYMRILKIDSNVNSTEVAGTFLAAGSASIWIFHFGASLYVSLGQENSGNMHGEAIFTFSFSCGFVHYDYSITAHHDQAPAGHNNSTSLEPRYAPNERRAIQLAMGDVRSDAADTEIVAVVAEALAEAKANRPADVQSLARCQSEDWATFASYFDLQQLKGAADYGL
jgi:hypothetical protein